MRSIALVEKNKIGFGITSRSSAKITFLQEGIYTKLVNNCNEDTAKNYYNSQKEAIKIIKNICTKENIDCELKKIDSYLYAINQQEIDKIKQEKDLIERFGEKVIEIKELPNNDKIIYGFKVGNTYQFHPVKFVTNLAKVSETSNHKIYENTRIVNILRNDNIYYCYTDNNIIKCKNVIIANHYPSFLFPFLFPLKCYLEKSYLLAYKRENKNTFSAINTTNPIYSMNYYPDYYLTIGVSHNLCFKDNAKKNFNSFIKKHKDKKYDYIWSNHDIMTIDNLPYIGYIKDNVLLATGFNTWGMTNGVLAGSIIADLLNDRYNKYEKLFNPKRETLGNKLTNYPINIFSTAYSFVKTKINKNKSWYKKNPYFTKINNVDVAIYKDENGKEYIVRNKCPHLKCGLIFNKCEKTWDCPCHGSKFTLEGKSIVGPSEYDITYKKEE